MIRSTPWATFDQSVPSFSLQSHTVHRSAPMRSLPKSASSSSSRSMFRSAAIRVMHEKMTFSIGRSRLRPAALAGGSTRLRARGIAGRSFRRAATADARFAFRAAPVPGFRPLFDLFFACFAIVRAPSCPHPTVYSTA